MKQETDIAMKNVNFYILIIRKNKDIYIRQNYLNNMTYIDKIIADVSFHKKNENEKQMNENNNNIKDN